MFLGGFHGFLLEANAYCGTRIQEGALKCAGYPGSTTMDGMTQPSVYSADCPTRLVPDRVAD